MKLTRFQTFALPLVVSICILAICYPGFMSFDSIRMLEEARTSVKGNPYPATPVYLLRLFDFAGHGLTMMLQTQNFILLLSLVMILRMLNAGLKASAIAVLTLLATPTVIGCMLVLWKDVTLASLMMLSIALIYWANQANIKDAYFHAAKWSSLLLLFLGTLVRLNAITATVAIVIYWLVVFCSRNKWWTKSLFFIAIIFFMVASDKVINNYTFPDLKKMPPNTIPYEIMAFDLIGISYWSRVSLIPFESSDSEPLPKATIPNIDRIYSSLGGLAINSNNAYYGYAVSLYPTKYGKEDIVKAWSSAVYNHPLAYLKYRWDLFSEIIGAKFHATFEPTHYNRIDENPFGITFQDRFITKITLKYIQSTSKIFLGKPWFIFLLSIASIFYISKSHLIHPKTKQLSYFSFAAALLYIAPFFIISGTGEVRYSFPSIVLSSIPVLILFFAHYLPQKLNLTNGVDR